MGREEGRGRNGGQGQGHCAPSNHPLVAILTGAERITVSLIGYSIGTKCSPSFSFTSLDDVQSCLLICTLYFLSPLLQMVSFFKVDPLLKRFREADDGLRCETRQDLSGQSASGPPKGTFLNARALP